MAEGERHEEQGMMIYEIDKDISYMNANLAQVIEAVDQVMIA